VRINDARTSRAILREGQGFRITLSALTLRGQVPNLDETKFLEKTRDAEKNCPVSKVLNAAITLDAKLI
jgi:lipoyl-dependent peroxiredoxin